MLAANLVEVISKGLWQRSFFWPAVSIAEEVASALLLATCCAGYCAPGWEQHFSSLTIRRGRVPARPRGDAPRLPRETRLNPRCGQRTNMLVPPTSALVILRQRGSRRRESPMKQQCSGRLWVALPANTEILRPTKNVGLRMTRHWRSRSSAGDVFSFSRVRSYLLPGTYLRRGRRCRRAWLRRDSTGSRP